MDFAALRAPLARFRDPDEAQAIITTERENPGAGARELAGFDPAQLPNLDRFAQGAGAAERTAWLPPELQALSLGTGLGAATAYEGVKRFAPGLLDALSAVSGLDEFKVDETTSAPSMERVLALGAGMSDALAPERQTAARVRLISDLLGRLR